MTKHKKIKNTGKKKKLGKKKAHGLSKPFYSQSVSFCDILHTASLLL